MKPLKSPSRTWAGASAAFAMIITAAVLIFMRTSVPHLPTRDRHHGPWIYGSPTAHFTIIEYADFECPYCRAYFPVLTHWIDEHREVSWQWRNLPLSMHEPMATREALLAECAGEVEGNSAFWRAAAWIYSHTGGNGAGISSDTQMPGTSPRVRACLESSRPAEEIRSDLTTANLEHLAATPTLRIIDRESRKSVLLQGPVDGDTLLSAIGFLAAESSGLQARHSRPR